MKFYLYSIALCCAGIFMGCQEDEELNLLGYPENPVSIVTPGESGDVSTMKVKATYNENGELVTATSLRHTWTVSLATPSPEDVVLQIAPYCVNIPVDKVELSETTIKIPAGYVSASVTVGLKDDDFSFAAENLEAQTYELGFNVVNAEGLNLKTESATGKMVIEKDPYLVHVSMAGENGNTVAMKRVCKDGDVIGGAVEYSFEVQLDRPVKEDLSISFSVAGIPEEFLGDASFTPAQVTIPAGEKNSGEIKWAISNDFLFANEEDEEFNIVLKPVFENTDMVSVNPDNESINITLNKTSSLLEWVSGIQPNWGQLERNSWTATLLDGWSGNASELFDNNTWGAGVQFVEINTSVGEIVIDLGKEENVVGFWAVYGYEYSYPSGYKYLSPLKTELFVSEDKSEWTSLGVVDTPSTSTSTDRHYINIVVPIKTRYIKYAGTVNSDYALMKLLEMKFYGEKEQ